MSETTKLPASFSNGAVFESSTAFLMLQKNANRRQTSMTDDVFRIFRRTGKKINEIASRIESERNIYLKDSYSHKNTLYKELSGIANVKNGQNATQKTRRAKIVNHMGALPRFASVNTSDLICRPVKSQSGRQKLGEDAEYEPEKRLNVNVLKRCECCRRLAFRYKEMSEKQKEENEGEEKDKEEKEEDEGQKNTSETQKLTDEILASVKQGSAANDDFNGRKTSKMFLYDKKISINEVVPTSFNSLRKQSKAALESPPRKMTLSGSVTAPPSPAKEEMKNVTRSRSYSVLMNKSSALVHPEPTPSPLSRQKIRVKFTNPTANEKIKVCGNAWSNHLRKLQDQDTTEKQTVVTLSKAYLAFRKLLRQMEEKRKKEEEALENEEYSPSSSTRNSPIPRNRFKTTAVSIAAASRWQPRKSLVQRTASLVNEHFTNDVIDDDATDHVNNDVTDKENNVIKGIEEDRVSIQSNDSDDNTGTFTVLEWNGSTTS